MSDTTDRPTCEHRWKWKGWGKWYYCVLCNSLAFDPPRPPPEPGVVWWRNIA